MEQSVGLSSGKTRIAVEFGGGLMPPKVLIDVTGHTPNDRAGALQGGPPWEHFQTFVVVARTGSFSKAAEVLDVTQPTITRRIGRLEAMLGTRLFDRSPRGRELTIEGARILNEVSAAEIAIARAMDRGKATARKIQADCKLLVGDGLGAYWLPRFIPSFLRANPSTALKLFTTDTPAKSQRTTFDLQIQYAPPQEADAVGVPLGFMHFMLYASPEYLQIHGIPASFSDLAHHVVLDHALYLTEKGTWSSQVPDSVSLQTSVFTNSSATLAEMVRAGSGIALLPTYASAIEPGVVVPVIPEYHIKTPMFLCFLAEAGKRPHVRSALDYLKSVAFDRRQMPWFAETFEPPNEQWPLLLKRRLMRAASQAIREQLAAE